MPQPEERTTRFESFFLEHLGHRLKIWKVNLGASKAIIYFGGNAEAVLGNADSFSKTFPDHTIYITNYRGYGGSTGEPSEKAFFEDALALHDQLKKSHDSISVIGRSLGSGTASYLAAERDIDRLILVTPMDSVRNVAKARYRIFPIDLLLQHPFDTDSRVASITCPILFLVAEHDTVIPPEHSLRLSKLFPEEQYTYKVFPGTDHNTIAEREEYYHSMKIFMSEGHETS